MNTVQHIMLIDDNKIDLFVNQRIIQNFDKSIVVSLFSSSVSALRYFEELELANKPSHYAVPNLILLDINMPELSGFQLLESFETMKLFKKQSIEVIMLSSSQSLNDIDDCMKMTICKNYFTKPLTLEKLEKSIYIPTKNYLMNLNQNQ